MPAPDGRPSRTSRRLCVTSTEDSIHRHVRARLASLDRRYTHGRRRLVDLLVEARRPVSLPELLAMDANIPQSSIYRNLEVLERSGLVHRLAVAGEHARFELAEPLLRHHHHLICTSCGAVHDITLPDDVEHLVQAALHVAADELDFDARHHRVDLHGHCASCAGTGDIS